MFFYRFQKILHLFGPNTEFGHFWAEGMEVNNQSTLGIYAINCCVSKQRSKLQGFCTSTRSPSPANQNMGPNRSISSEIVVIPNLFSKKLEDLLISARILKSRQLPIYNILSSGWSLIHFNKCLICIQIHMNVNSYQ